MDLLTSPNRHYTPAAMETVCATVPIYVGCEYRGYANVAVLLSHEAAE
jgi:hypothetical protein